MDSEAGYASPESRSQMTGGKTLRYVVLLALFMFHHFFNEYIFIRFLYFYLCSQRPIFFQGAF